MWLFYLNLNFTAIISKCKIKWIYNNFSENNADEPNADELNADEHNADGFNADEHIADELNAHCWRDRLCLVLTGALYNIFNFY